MHEIYRTLDQDSLTQEVVAFAMTFHACLYVNQVAQHKELPHHILAAYTAPILLTNPSHFSELLPCGQTLQSALGALIGLLRGGELKGVEHPSRAHQSLQDNRHLRQIVLYTHGALKLRKLLLGNSEKMGQLENRLHIIARFQQLQQNPQELSQQQQMIAKLASLYLDIFGDLGFRIIIQGNQDALADPHKVEQIRCLLLGAVRFGMLWQQVGGRQWKLLFQRGKMLAIAQDLYKRVQQAQLKSASDNIVKIKP